MSDQISDRPETRRLQRTDRGTVVLQGGDLRLTHLRHDRLGHDRLRRGQDLGPGGRDGLFETAQFAIGRQPLGMHPTPPGPDPHGPPDPGEVL